MQSVRFIELLNKICEELRIAPLIQCLSPLVVPEKGRADQSLNPIRGRFNDLVFSARDNLAFLSKDPDAALLLKELGLFEAFSGDSISRLLFILQSRTTENQVRVVPSEIMDIQFFFAILKAIKRLQTTMLVSIAEPRAAGIKKSESAIEFEVLDLGSNGFELTRIEEILPLIDDLYRQLCMAYGLPQEPPRILYMDSGSGLVIGLKGSGEIIEAVRKLFLTVWDKIRFKKHEEIGKNLEAIDSTLDVLQKIQSGVDAGNLTSEDAARLKHKIMDDALSLLSNGTSLREIQTQEVLENRKLLIDMASVKYLRDREGPSVETPSTGL